MKKLKGIRNKGFSLVELIIVVAIMVALVAVVAPSYVKYVKTTKDSVVENAAESISKSIKVYYTDGSFRSDNCVILVYMNQDKQLDIKYDESNGSGSFSFNGVKDDFSGLKEACGFQGKKVDSDKQFLITVSASESDIQMLSGVLKEADVQVDPKE